MTKRILLVDDDENTCKALSFLLRSEGYEVDTFHAPEPALERLRAHAYDLLVTDQVMNGMSGLDLARRSLDLRAGLRCFVISGQAAPAPELREHVTWIDKPVDVDVLLSAIRPA